MDQKENPSQETPKSPEPPPPQAPTPVRTGSWGRFTRRVVVIGLILLALYVFSLISDTLTTFILAVLLAFLLSPLVAFLHRTWRIPRLAGTALVYIILVG